MSDEVGGRLFFTNVRRGLVDEDEINLTSVGIDIGSSTTHLAFSCITLERADARYIVVSRNLFFESDILLTPYAAHNEIDTEKLGTFIDEQYRLSGIGAAEVDTGALILTGTALLRKNARAIADIFSESAGKFVAVSAGDEMEALLAAHGSGAVARSAKGQTVLNVDIGGGTTKIARCVGGQVDALTALDVGARLIAVNSGNIVTRLEPAGREFARLCGVPVEMGQALASADMERIASAMADKLLQVMRAEHTTGFEALLRLPSLPPAPLPDVVIFSGGVSEYFYGRESRSYGDLGPLLARELATRMKAWGVTTEPSTEGIRATVIGASQYTVQVSGSTIFVSDLSVLPLRNIPAIKPPLALDAPDSAVIASAIRVSMARLGSSYSAIALCYSWNQSATFARLDAFCRGVSAAFGDGESSVPLILVGDSDVGGLIGLHFAEELKVKRPIVSIDGISLRDFDFIDIGAFLEGSGSLPVVVKSLIFPASHKSV